MRYPLVVHLKDGNKWFHAIAIPINMLEKKEVKQLPEAMWFIDLASATIVDRSLVPI